MRDVERCWKILPKVSRSFALCIRILPRPMNEQMMVSYLIYRVIDTIEDSDAPLDGKKALFAQFVKALSQERLDAAAVARCRKELCKLGCTYEKELLQHVAAVVKTYYAQPADVRGSILRWGRVMARGMYEFQKKRIETFEDQNRYSYYVAGVVGYLFNDLLYFNGIIGLRLKLRLHRYARKFGLALQKVNILRDIAHDIAGNRHYWPRELMAKYRLSYENLCSSENREAAMKVLREQINDARDYLYAAMKYVLMLPKKALQVRMFCLIPLFMAIESYAKCIDNYDVFNPEKKVKISRLRVQEIVAKSGLWGTSNERLVNWFFDTMVRTGPDFAREEYVRSLSRVRN